MGLQGRYRKGDAMGRIDDIGELHGDVLLFGGPYSNLQATEALFDWAHRAMIPPEQRICTGDMVAYCGDPVAVLNLMQAQGGPCIAGNCEQQLAAGAQDCGCGFAAGSTCARLSQDWYAHANQTVTAAQRAHMAALPELLLFRHTNKRYAVIHGGTKDVSRFLWPCSRNSEFMEEINHLRDEVGAIDGVVSGHSGLPFERHIDGVHWINAGVIGMPPNDGAPETGFAVLSKGEVRFECLSYDVDAAAAAMTSAGLTQGYEQSLKTGYWPSEEVLPRAMRRQSRAIG